MNTYVDCITYSKSPTGLQIDDYIGNIARITSTALGATTLTLTAPLTVALNWYDNVYLFDGPSSEVVVVGSAGAGIGATTIPLVSGTQYAHNGGTPYCTDGTSGSLGEQIFTASKWIEDDICNQSLWSTAYTGEVLTMPTMRAAIDNQFNLHFRPRHYPITALNSISIRTSQQNNTSYDPSQAVIDADQQTVDFPLLIPLGGQGNNWYGSGIGRGTTAWVTIGYTAGFAVGALPRIISRACILLTSECFNQLENPMGADSIQQNKRTVNFVLRGDTTGESLLIKQAKDLLSSYIMEAL